MAMTHVVFGLLSTTSTIWWRSGHFASEGLFTASQKHQNIFWGILTQFWCQIVMLPIIVNTCGVCGYPCVYVWVRVCKCIQPGGWGWGGVDLVSANPWFFPDVIVVAVVSDHPLSRMARGQLPRPSQTTTSVNICCTTFQYVTGVLACLTTAASSHSGVKCQWRHKLRAGRPLGPNNSVSSRWNEI